MVSVRPGGNIIRSSTGGGTLSLEQGYAQILDILGATGLVIPLGDATFEATSSTLVTTGAEEFTFTASEAWADWDTAPSTINGVPILTFNGTDEEADSPDDAYWSRVSGAFSIGAWVNVVDATNSSILTKFDTAGNTREWMFRLNGTSDAEIYLADESVPGDFFITTVGDDLFPEGSWVFLVATADGTADATGLNLYQQGVVVDSTDVDSATFVALEDLAGTVKLGFTNATPSNFFDGKMAGAYLGPFFTQTELTAAKILQLYNIGKQGLGV